MRAIALRSCLVLWLVQDVGDGIDKVINEFAPRLVINPSAPAIEPCAAHEFVDYCIDDHTSLLAHPSFSFAMAASMASSSFTSRS